MIERSKRIDIVLVLDTEVLVIGNRVVEMVSRARSTRRREMIRARWMAGRSGSEGESRTTSSSSSWRRRRKREHPDRRVDLTISNKNVMVMVRTI
jgi:hypothetical protein